jgi:hypothetical protein
VLTRFRLCKDPSKRFCPSCGNPTLLRTTVTTTSAGVQRVHLKKNFQYHLRGTKFSIPDAKPGRAKGQQKGGSGLILREDQMEWQDAVRRREGEARKEEKRAKKGALEGRNDPDVSGWAWVWAWRGFGRGVWMISVGRVERFRGVETSTCRGVEGPIRRGVVGDHDKPGDRVVPVRRTGCERRVSA